jgi:hypothetical protein
MITFQLLLIVTIQSGKNYTRIALIHTNTI